MNSNFMDSANETLLLALKFEDETEPHEAERWSRDLRKDLLDTDVEDVTPRQSRAAPDGAKGLDTETLQWLITLSASGGVLTTVISTARAWIERSGRDHKVSITMDGDKLELDKVSNEDQAKLIKEFLRRHTKNE